MAIRSTIRTQILSLVSSHQMIVASDVNTLIDTCHQEILESYAWTRRKAETILSTVATYSTGTVSGSAGSTTITGSSTVWTAGMVDRFIRIGTNTFFHRISAVGSATSLTIEGSDGLPEAVAAGSTYTIFRHIYDLPANFGRALNVTSDVRLVETTRSDLDRLDSYRTATASKPDRFCIVGLDSPGSASGVYQIEFYPVPSSATVIRAQYLRNNDLDEDTDEPLYRSDCLVWRGAESACFFLHSKTGDAAWLALADRYHNRYKEALEGAINDDIAKFSAPTHIREAGYDDYHGSDFYLDKDVWRP